MATIRDVAKAAGVSAMTVSNVINEHPGVRPATRDKVLDAMARLDYRVNVAARNLRKGRTGTIGFAVPEINRPYYGRLAAAVIAAAERRGLRVSVEQTGALVENELAALTRSRNRLYDGLIISAVGLGANDAEWSKVDHPVVVLGERMFSGRVDHIAMPNVDASRAATHHLIERGCRRIAFLRGAVGHDADVSSLRQSGYRQALASAGLAPDADLEQCLTAFTMEAGARCARQMVSDGLDFDGVFCVTDTVAMGVLRGLADAGVRVPHDVKVIGFDNVDESAFLVPSLSTVDPDHDTMAEHAVARLVRRIEQPGPAVEPEECVGRFSVVVRESTGGPGRPA
ncbi:LacI family DNA-binding transcriptional regulator [Streptomyces sp. NPDC002928]|uniref:LacI family DNA-binding transcriptional regulator n=1 Tax=Streptomyces sp. NPDC002928 TaxID=3154440 RepID=UPI0033AE59C8